MILKNNFFINYISLFILVIQIVSILVIKYFLKKWFVKYFSRIKHSHPYFSHFNLKYQKYHQNNFKFFYFTFLLSLFSLILPHFSLSSFLLKRLKSSTLSFIFFLTNDNTNTQFDGLASLKIK